MDNESQLAKKLIEQAATLMVQRNLGSASVTATREWFAANISEVEARAICVRWLNLAGGDEKKAQGETVRELMELAKSRAAEQTK